MNDLRKAAETKLFRLLGDENHDIQLRAAIALLQLPPKREWVGLTDEDLEPMCDDWRIIFGPYVHDFTKAIEAKLKEKNT